MEMTPHTIEAGIEIAPTAMIADALRDGILREVECAGSGEASLDVLRRGASQLAALALGAGWHDPHDSFSRALVAATRSGVPSANARGILIGAFEGDYGEPASVPSQCLSRASMPPEAFAVTVGRTLALIDGPQARLSALEQLGLDAKESIAEGRLDHSGALDDLVNAADAQGLVSQFGRDTVEHVCGMALNGQRALIRSGISMTGTEKQHLASGRELISSRASAIEIEHVAWLMPGRIALGAQTVIAGMPGTGKSTLVAEIAATVSTGGRWPTGERAPMGNVLLLSAEDSARNTLVPRLMAANADLERVEIIQGTRSGDSRKTFNLVADVDLLERKAREWTEVKMIIVDPLSAYFGGVDARKNADVRAALEPLGEFAERMGIAVLSVTHLNKSGQGAAINRVIDSIAITGAARAAYMVGKDPDDDSRRIFASLKNNLAREASPLAYRLGERLIGKKQVLASHVLWDSEPVEVTAAEILAAADSSGGDRTAKQEAVEFLRELLAEGPVLQTEVRSQADAVGFSYATVKRAKREARVKASRVGEEGVRGGGRWFWHFERDWPPRAVPAAREELGG
jgi:hypothetical protein